MLSVSKDDDPFDGMDLDDDEMLNFAGEDDRLLVDHHDRQQYHDMYMDEEVDEEQVEQYEEIYDEGLEHVYEDVEPYLHNPHYAPDVNPEFIDAHYINTDQEFLAQQNANLAQDIFDNPKFLEPTSTARRLAAYPEQHQIRPVRRHWRPNYSTEDDSSPYMPICGKSLDPEESSENHMLHRNKIYPKHGEIFVKPAVDPRLKKPKRRPPRPTEPADIINHKMSVAIRKAARPRPVCYPDSRNQEHMDSMTPLPNIYFQKRLTGTAEQIGFKSDNAKCLICDFIFRQRALLASHMKKHENRDFPIIKPSIGMLCPVSECNTRCDTLASTVKHMKVDHQIYDLSFERIVFKNMTEFKLWKAELERLTMSKYSRTSGRKNAYSKSTYYQCQLSGNGCGSKSRPSVSYHGSQDIPRQRASKKLAKACTAFFHVREDEDGSVILRGCTKHSGHGRDVRLLPLTEEIKMEIAHMLITGMEEDEIIEKMRLESDVSDRRFYLQPYEVRNVFIKIDKFKEEFKRKIENGEPIPDLLNLGQDREVAQAYPVGKAQLACSRYPIDYDPENDVIIDPEFDSLVVEQDDYTYEQVIQEDGVFQMPEQDYDYFEEEEYEIAEGEELQMYQEDEGDVSSGNNMLPEEEMEVEANLQEEKFEHRQEEEMPQSRTVTPSPKPSPLEEIRTKKATRSIDKKMQKLFDSQTPEKIKPSVQEEKTPVMESGKKTGVTSPVGRNTARKQAAKRRKIDQTTLCYEDNSDDEEKTSSEPSTSTAHPTRFSNRLKGKKEAKNLQEPKPEEKDSESTKTGHEAPEDKQ